MQTSREPFEPVLIDLDLDTYLIVTAALDDYAAEQDHEAQREDERVRDNDLPESDSGAEAHRTRALRARAIRDDIERQMDANAAARRG